MRSEFEKSEHPPPPPPTGSGVRVSEKQVLIGNAASSPMIRQHTAGAMQSLQTTDPPPPLRHGAVQYAKRWPHGWCQGLRGGPWLGPQWGLGCGWYRPR